MFSGYNYERTFEAAGAIVLDSWENAGYSGSGLACVDYGGVRGIVRWDFGCCGGCDHLLSETFTSEEQKAAFGREYLNDKVSYAEALAAEREGSEAHSVLESWAHYFG